MLEAEQKDIVWLFSKFFQKKFSLIWNIVNEILIVQESMILKTLIWPSKDNFNKILIRLDTFQDDLMVHVIIVYFFSQWVLKMFFCTTTRILFLNRVVNGSYKLQWASKPFLPIHRKGHLLTYIIPF